MAFSVPVANAEVERLFSLMKRIETETRCLLGTRTLENIVHEDINHEGPPLLKYDSLAAIDTWAEQKPPRINQHARRSYKNVHILQEIQKQIVKHVTQILSRTRKSYLNCFYNHFLNQFPLS